jgi:hypothetical protein
MPFSELDRNLQGWFGKKKRSKEIIKSIITKLGTLQRSADTHDEDVKRKNSREIETGNEVSVGGDIDHLHVKLGARDGAKERNEVERSFKVHREKLQELDRWLPELKESIRAFFTHSSNTSAVVPQIDDLYHLKRTDQAFVVDYIHRLCKDVPLYFKIATLRHASTLYADRDGQPIGALERHDYQPINIDYTFSDFKETEDQNWQILEQFGWKARLNKNDVHSLFKGQGFGRLVMAGGGVPRDVLSLFLEVLSDVASKDGRIGKDDVRDTFESEFRAQD